METAITQSGSEAKLEAEQFLRRITIEYPHLVGFGYQRIIDVTVEGMVQLGIHSLPLTEATFRAGLVHMMTIGAIPNREPIAAQPPAPTAEEIAATRERERLIAKAQADEKAEQQTKKLNAAQNRPRPQHAENTIVLDMADTAETIRSMFHSKQEQNARNEAEGVTVYRHNQRVDSAMTAEVQKIFARDREGNVLWAKTAELRNIAAKNAEEHNRRKVIQRDSY